MKDKNIYLLSTRPLDKALVNKALEYNLLIESISFIKTENIIDTSISETIKALASETITAVFTSTNGAEAVIESLRANFLQPVWNIYSIGAATQSIIKKYFTASRIVGTGKNAHELSKTIIENSEEEVFFFCGNQRRDELPEHLHKNRIPVKEIVVYETKETPVKIDKEYKGILFFSPSAVKSFFSVNSIAHDTVLFSIGETTEDAIKKNCDNNKIVVSNFPSMDKLVEEAMVYFDTINKAND